MRYLPFVVLASWVMFVVAWKMLKEGRRMIWAVGIYMCAIIAVPSAPAWLIWFNAAPAEPEKEAIIFFLSMLVWFTGIFGAIALGTWLARRKKLLLPE